MVSTLFSRLKPWRRDISAVLEYCSERRLRCGQLPLALPHIATDDGALDRSDINEMAAIVVSKKQIRYSRNGVWTMFPTADFIDDQLFVLVVAYSCSLEINVIP